jgi:hypothetical protein
VRSVAVGDVAVVASVVAAAAAGTATAIEPVDRQ